MRAQCVYENLDFERGQDPLKSIGVGLSDPDWANIKKGDTYILTKDVLGLGRKKGTKYTIGNINVHNSSGVNISFDGLRPWYMNKDFFFDHFKKIRGN